MSPNQTASASETAGTSDGAPSAAASGLEPDFGGPSLEPGLTLLRVPSARSPVIHRLACSRLREAGGPAYWIDARNVASTHALYDCAPSPRTLRGLRVARAFTAYQHHSLVRRVVERADGRTTLVVAPNATDRYRDADLADWEREDLLSAALSTLSELGRALECPVVVTTASEAAAETVADHADADVTCRRTREGIRFERADGSDDATAGYWRGDYWQTTIPYWVERCGAVGAIDPAVAAHDRGLLDLESAGLEAGRDDDGNRTGVTA